MRANNRLISAKANLRDAQVKRLWRGRSQNPSCRSVHVKDEKWSATANLRDAQVKRLWRGRSQNSSCRSVHVKDEKWSATANLRDAQVKRPWRDRSRSQNQIVVRFWIITMMLVLAGLSTVKLR